MIGNWLRCSTYSIVHRNTSGWINNDKLISFLWFIRELCFMTLGNSKWVESNQTGPHEKLPEIVRRHLANASQKPYSEHTRIAFNDVQAWLDGWRGPLILDSCCGTGESTHQLALRYPEAKIIGIDKSIHRLERHSHQTGQNYRLVQADLIDFWRLAIDAGWQLNRHFLLYPNPYPKSAHLQRRWYAMPSLVDILTLGGILTVRSNWPLYIQEFQIALSVAGIDSNIFEIDIAEAEAMTLFEKKYLMSHQPLWELTCTIVGR